MRYFKLIGIGLIIGTIFGLLLKIIEQVTTKRVYTLLLNVDYFPLLKNWEFPETIEFSFHLIVSIGLVVILYEVLKRFNQQANIQLYIFINTMIGVCLYPLTLFSTRTPAFNDITAFFYWVIAHLIFGALVGIFIKYIVNDVNNKRY